MDKNTFDRFFEDDFGVLSKVVNLPNLNVAEQSMHKLLYQNNWRLEQEKIPMDYTLIQLNKLIKEL